MNNIKCILLDIDNTLTNKNEEISNETIEYFNRNLKGYYTILVTGRTNRYAVEKSKMCSASPIVISDNGAIIYNYEEDKVLYNNFFNSKVIKKIWKISQKNNIDCVFNTIYKRYRNNIYMNDEYLKNNNIGINSIDELQDNVSQIVLFSNNEIEYNKCLNDIKILKNVEVSNKGQENDGRYFADLNVTGTSKGKAIIELYKFLNITKENSICFGDSSNDITMFEQSGYKVAMKNSTEAIKKLADSITEFSNNENGVIEFLKKYLK